MKPITTLSRRDPCGKALKRRGSHSRLGGIHRVAFDIFISHASGDKVTAEATCAKLEACGIRCWIAPRDILPGTDWGAAIVDAIDQCRLMVLVFSARANESHQIRNEIARAVDRGIPVVPLRIEDIVPTHALAYYMTAVHWLDALTPPLEEHLDRLAQSIRALLQIDAPEPFPSRGKPPHGAAGQAAAPSVAAAAPPPVVVALPSARRALISGSWFVRAFAVFGLIVIVGAGVLVYARAANSEACQRMWAERNGYYKLRGYCFKTPTAIAAFGNEGCTTDDPAKVFAENFSSLERERVKRIRFWEWVYGCTI